MFIEEDKDFSFKDSNQQSLKDTAFSGIDLENINNIIQNKDSLENEKSIKIEKEAIENLLKGVNQKKPLPNGMSSLIDSDIIYYERLPLLEIIFERFIRIFSTSLKNFVSEHVDIVCEKISTIRFKDAINDLSLPCMIGVIHSNEWRNKGLFALDNHIIYAIIELLTGGEKNDLPDSSLSRSYTTIEQKIIEKIFHIASLDINKAFTPVAKVNFFLERTETTSRFAIITRPSNATISLRLHVSIEEKSGTIDFILPYATIEPIRHLLLQSFMGEKFGNDSMWENHLAKEVWNTNLSLEAVLPSATHSLKDVLAWKVGSRIILNADPLTPVMVHCDGYPLLEGQMGKKSGKIAIKIDEILFRR